jgi:hypothetical protein
MTHHGTVLFADLERRRICHAPATAGATNLFLVQNASKAYLVHRASDGRFHAVLILPEQRSDDRVEMELDYSLELVLVPSPAKQLFGFGRHGLFLCAEPDGSVTLSREKLGPWETFGAAPWLAT